MGSRRLLLAVCLLAMLARPAFAAEGGEAGAAIDAAVLSCRGAEALATADPDAFAALGVWLDGWLNGKANETRFDPVAIGRRADGWRQACGTAPDRPLLAVAATVGAPGAAGPDGFDMAFLKCFQFLDLAEEDRGRAVTVVRWIDGWHAGALGQTAVTLYDHEKMTGGFAEACAKRPYHRKNLIRVAGGNR